MACSRACAPTKRRAQWLTSVCRGDKPSKDQPVAGALTVAGIRVSHPERVVYRKGAVTKGDLARY